MVLAHFEMILTHNHTVVFVGVTWHGFASLSVLSVLGLCCTWVKAGERKSVNVYIQQRFMCSPKHRHPSAQGSCSEQSWLNVSLHVTEAPFLMRPSICIIPLSAVWSFCLIWSYPLIFDFWFLLKCSSFSFVCVIKVIFYFKQCALWKLTWKHFSSSCEVFKWS